MSFSTMTLQQQRGGTFLGIILGVVFGLAVALGVAIYVAKVPIPFVNKNTSRSSDQDAAEAEKNRAWDPNGALRGKNGGSGSVSGGAVVPAPAPAPAPEPAPLSPAEVAKPAARSTPVPVPAEVKPAERTVESKPATRGEKASEPATASKPATQPQRAPSNDPLGDFAAARAGGNAAKPAPAAAGADPFTYFVQAGAFRTPEDADAQRARLSLMGVEARVTEREQSGRTVYRVRVGPFQNHDAASRVKERLDGNGFDSALVRVAR